MMKSRSSFIRHLSFISLIWLYFGSGVASAGGQVIFLRHALAPGTGDPAHFKIEDCSTQRNLNAQGRQQAQSIGQELKDKGLLPTRILSSPWCRCKDTASLLGLGRWQTHFGLSSFYENHVDQEDVLAALQKELEGLQDNETLLLVTHQVVISAVTGAYMPSGGYLVVDSEDIQWD